MKIFVARHGQTEWNKENKVCGRTDLPLTDKGIEQANVLAKKISLEEINVIISSPLLRAKETSNIISNYINAPVAIDKRLIEQNYGIYEGVDRHNIDFLNNKKNFAFRYPNGESMFQVASRVYPLIDEIKNKYIDKNVLIISHGGVCRIINAYFNDMTNEDFFNYRLSNAEYESFTL